MADKTTRRRILSYLYDIYKTSPYKIRSTEEIADELGIPFNEAKSELIYLHQKEFVDTYFDTAGDVWAQKINANGIDELERLENSQNFSDNKIIAGRDVNIINAGNDNKIESKESLPSENRSYSKTRIIIAIIGIIAAVIPASFIIYDHLYPKETSTYQPPEVIKNQNDFSENNSGTSIQIAGNNHISNSQINVINGAAQTKSTAIIQFEDLSTDRKILLPIGFETPKREYYYEDKVRLVGALPGDGIINVKLAKINFQQYNDSLFYLFTPYLDQPIPPLLVSAGNLNKTVTFNVLPNYGSSQEYQDRNDTDWYTAPVGNITFQFNYSNVQNNFQTFNFTQLLWIKVKGCLNDEGKPITCK